jgi:hypothetical protein
MSSLPLAAKNLVRHERHLRQDVQPQRDPSNDLTARLALDARTRNDAFSVRHDSYLSGGYIDARPDGLFSDENDDLPNSQTVVVYRKSRPVASIRFCILDTDPTLQGWDDIPALHVFPEEVKTLMDNVNAAHLTAALSSAGRPETPQKFARAVEINRLVRHPDFKDDSELVFVLFRFATYMVLHHDADLTLSCVRKNHMPFYRRIIKLQNVAGPRQYHGVKFATHLMACDREKYASVVRDVPIFNSAKILQGGYDALFEGETVNVFGDQ